MVAYGHQCRRFRNSRYLWRDGYGYQLLPNQEEGERGGLAEVQIRAVQGIPRRDKRKPWQQLNTGW